VVPGIAKPSTETARQPSFVSPITALVSHACCLAQVTAGKEAGNGNGEKGKERLSQLLSQLEECDICYRHC